MKGGELSYYSVNCEDGQPYTEESSSFKALCGEERG